MKIRVKYSKTGLMRYIGHLDVLRYFQKAVRRSGIRASYSDGYSPHMIMSFAEPLGIGLITAGDYFDLSLDYRDPFGELPENEGRDLPEAPCAETLRAMLDREMTEDFSVLSVRRIPPYRKDNGMSQVNAASYSISFPYEGGADALADALSAYLSETSIPAVKKSKSGTRTVDLRPMILSLSVSRDSDRFFPEGDAVVRLLALAGSESNLPPQLLAESFLAYAGQEVPSHRIRIRRNDLYHRTEDGLVPLEDLGQIW